MGGDFKGKEAELRGGNIKEEANRRGSLNVCGQKGKVWGGIAQMGH